jgi:hypothetical protein
MNTAYDYWLALPVVLTDIILYYKAWFERCRKQQSLTLELNARISFVQTTEILPEILYYHDLFNGLPQSLTSLVCKRSRVKPRDYALINWAHDDSLTLMVLEHLIDSQSVQARLTNLSVLHECLIVSKYDPRIDYVATLVTYDLPKKFGLGNDHDMLDLYLRIYEIDGTGCGSLSRLHSSRYFTTVPRLYLGI